MQQTITQLDEVWVSMTRPDQTGPDHDQVNIITTSTTSASSHYVSKWCNLNYYKFKLNRPQQPPGRLARQTALEIFLPKNCEDFLPRDSTEFPRNSTRRIPVKLHRNAVYCIEVQIINNSRLRWIVMRMWRLIIDQWSNASSLDCLNSRTSSRPHLMYLHMMMKWRNEWNWFYQTTNNRFQPCCAFFVSERQL